MKPWESDESESPLLASEAKNIVISSRGRIPPEYSKKGAIKSPSAMDRVPNFAFSTGGPKMRLLKMKSINYTKNKHIL